jgi:citrate lyase subunit beta/citryl-CoA lyase
MRLRSLLFVPGDRLERMEKALSSGADALILDLEDSVALENKEKAHATVAAFLGRPHEVPMFVRINPLHGGFADADLDVVAPYHPAGIVLPKAEGVASVIELNRRLRARRNIDTRILPIATETPAAIFALGSFSDAKARLCGLTWGAEDLSAVLGATPRDSDGRLTPPFATVRSLALFAAHAAGVAAIETIYPGIKDEAGLSAYAAQARRDGFSGMLAIHPAQISAIHAAFAPTAAEVENARRVVQAFEQNAGTGAIQLDGKMLDAPHLSLARTILASLPGKGG